ncbi:MAG TPA: alpha/beta hydrolase [Gemmatimonadales bacterium]|jgi:pimeloyl-ACP methyl ester carboxylesterase|nr:alpha/beta hydrolase [Gemmatimonadales bacterium]
MFVRQGRVGIAEIYYVPAPMPHPLFELGGHGPLVILLPANGFPPESYLPALEPLFSRYRVVSLPPRGMWEDAGAAPTRPGTWLTLAEDLLAGMRRHALPPAIVIGHSFGAVSGLLSAVRDRARFRALGLLDPTIFPPRLLAEFAEERRKGATSSRPLVRAALTRRDRFAGEAEAFTHWRGKPLFADWPEDSLRRYTQAMLLPAAEGGFRLRWRPDWEAHYYESIYTESWDDLAKLDPALPLLVVRGERSDTYLPEAAALLSARAPWARQRSIAGRGHFFPQSAPAETSRVLLDWLEAAGL